MSDQRIRGRRLQRIRKAMLSDNPLCELCLAKGIIKAAVAIDHIQALMNGGQDIPENRQRLCLRCHDAKTRRDKGFGPSGACDVDGNPIDPGHPWA